MSVSTILLFFKIDFRTNYEIIMTSYGALNEVLERGYPNMSAHWEKKKGVKEWRIQITRHCLSSH